MYLFFFFEHKIGAFLILLINLTQNTQKLFEKIFTFSQKNTQISFEILSPRTTFALR